MGRPGGTGGVGGGGPAGPLSLETFLLRGGFGGVELGKVFGGVLLELADAHLAAELDLAVGFTLFLVSVFDRAAHVGVVEGLTGHDARGERVGGLGGFIFGAERGEAEDESEGGEGDEFIHFRR
jgi:hypothetical protein